jgi:hypothetical protein
MKRLVNVIDIDEDGLESLLGEYVQLWCMNYIYAGRLIGVNQDAVCLAESVVVYETGRMTDKGWKLAESTGLNELFIRIPAIESYGLAPSMHE